MVSNYNRITLIKVEVWAILPTLKIGCFNLISRCHKHNSNHKSLKITHTKDKQNWTQCRITKEYNQFRSQFKLLIISMFLKIQIIDHRSKISNYRWSVSRNHLILQSNILLKTTTSSTSIWIIASTWMILRGRSMALGRSQRNNRIPRLPEIQEWLQGRPTLTKLLRSNQATTSTRSTRRITWTRRSRRSRANSQLVRHQWVTTTKRWILVSPIRSNRRSSRWYSHLTS